MATITTAAREYASRPADEKFPTLDALIEHAQHQKAASLEKTVNAKDLRVIGADAAGVQLIGPAGQPANFTHWSFGQLCRSLTAPANYLRSLPGKITADALNYGLSHTPPASDIQLLMQRPNGKPEPTIRACTSESYGRIWDADIYAQVRREITATDERWTLPPTWSGEGAGAYRGDRDSFLIMVNGGSIVTDPSLANAGSLMPAPGGIEQSGMYRGIMIRNSEVGAASITIETVLYRYICGNHMLWGAAFDTRFRRRHTGQNAGRDAVRELARVAWQYTNQSAARDEAIIRGLIDRQIATTKEAVIDELRALGARKEDAARAYELCEQTEHASPRSFWGAAQGLTRASQEAGYQDARYDLDQVAAKLLSRGAKLVAA